MQGTTIDTTAFNPIYLEMGTAVQDCQRLELYISFIVTLLRDLGNGTLSDDEFKWSLDSLASHSLGHLIEQIKKRVGFTDQAVEALRQALRARNFLIHRFFNARSDLFITQAGREKALKEIRQKRETLVLAAAMLDPVMNDLIRLKGIDIEQVKAEVAKRFES